MTDSDTRLIQRAKSGDRRAFGKLVKKNQERILFLAYDLVGDQEEAKDLAQESFIRAFEKLPLFEERSQFSTWLYRITVNLAKDYHRRKNRRSIESLDESMQIADPATFSPDSQDPLEGNSISEHLEEALDKLSIKQRTATVLRYFHQKSSREIAEIMGCAESTARIHVFRGVANLKKILA
ncbi:sigma-70 family RNA polymerase sigma factor [candidate division KSB1 bacterium]|nr:sigma-70 family RNA polymerase sigma factor [candidate division KSB1 bacterium]